MISFSNYNKEEYSDFLAKHDYLGAANYLSQFVSKNEDTQRTINSAINDLKDKAASWKYSLDNADEDTKQALYFKDAWDNKTQLDSNGSNVYVNKFTDSYKKAVDLLTNDEIIFDDKIHKNYFLGIDMFSGDKEYYESGWDLFKHNLGLSPDETQARKELDDLGIVFWTDDEGRTRMKLNVTNEDNHLKVIQALDVTDTNHSILNGADEKEEGVKGAKRWSASSKHIVSDAVESWGDVTPQSIFNRPLPQNPLQFADLLTRMSGAQQLTKWGAEIVGGLSDWVGNAGDVTPEDAISEASAIYKEASDKYDKFMGRSENGEITTNMQIYAGLASYDHMLLEDYKNRGYFKTDSEYNTEKKRLDARIKGILMNSTGAYLDHDIYSVDRDADSDEEHFTLSKVEKSKDREAIIDDIVSNLSAGNINVETDLSFAITHDGDGMLISIEPSDKVKNEHNSLAPYFKATRRQYFVKNLCDSEALSKYRQTEDYRAIQKLNRCIYNGQPMDISIDPNATEYIQPGIIVDENGNKTIDRNNLVRVVSNKDGIISSKPIDKRTALVNLKTKELANSIANEAIHSLYNPNGEYRGNINLDKQLDNVINASMKLLYPEETDFIENGEKLGYDISQQQSFIQEMYQKMLNYVMNKIQNHENNTETE